MIEKKKNEMKKKGGGRGGRRARACLHHLPRGSRPASLASVVGGHVSFCLCCF